MPNSPVVHKNHLGLWAVVQLGLFFRLLGELLVGGLAASILRRRFRGWAFFAGLGVLVLGLGALGALTFMPRGMSPVHTGLWFWCVAMSVMVVGGGVIARVGKTIGYHECYLATLIVTALIAIHMAMGWHKIFGFYDDTYSVGFSDAIAPGVALLGPQWQRVLALAAGVGFLGTLIGASGAFLFFGSHGRWSGAFGVEWWIARRYLGVGGGLSSMTAVVAMIGIGLGVAALVSVTAVMSGYQQDVQDKILSTNPHLVVQKYGIDFEEYPKVIADGTRVPGVVAASPFSYSEALMSDGELGLGVQIKGVVPETAGKVTAVEQNLCQSISGRHM
ncbi:MAG: ABC transporter permease [Myxococcota bacterium]